MNKFSGNYFTKNMLYLFKMRKIVNKKFIVSPLSVVLTILVLLLNFPVLLACAFDDDCSYVEKIFKPYCKAKMKSCERIVKHCGCEMKDCKATNPYSAQVITGFGSLKTFNQNLIHDSVFGNSNNKTTSYTYHSLNSSRELIYLTVGNLRI